MLGDLSSVPLGPRSHFLLGHLPAFGGDLLSFLTSCARECGDVVRLRLGATKAVLLNDPHQIEQVLVTRHAECIKYRFFWRHVARVFGNGLLTSTGNLWRHQHALIAPAFRLDRLAESADMMVGRAAHLVERWRDGEQRDIREDMTRLTLEIAARVLFDEEFDGAVDRISRAVDRGMAEVANRFKRGFVVPDWFPAPGNRRYRATVRDLNAIAIGVAAGLGLYLLAVAATALAILVLVGFGNIERRFLEPHQSSAPPSDDT